SWCARGLDQELGPVLVQLPPKPRVDTDALERSLVAFPRRARVAVELCYERWFDPAVRSLLEKAGAASFLTDTDGRHGPLWRTTDWRYLGSITDGAPSCYGRAPSTPGQGQWPSFGHPRQRCSPPSTTTATDVRLETLTGLALRWASTHF